ncbi:hypothetical protein [[Limnothrix rosea] IAM M-220]|nr:hypothetical protein [[Limnothrix rosea] IAM M-220]
MSFSVILQVFEMTMKQASKAIAHLLFRLRPLNVKVRIEPTLFQL